MFTRLVFWIAQRNAFGELVMPLRNTRFWGAFSGRTIAVSLLARRIRSVALAGPPCKKMLGQRKRVRAATSAMLGLIVLEQAGPWPDPEPPPGRLRHWVMCYTRRLTGGDSDSTPVSTPGVHVERVVTLVNQLLQLYSCQRR